MADQQQYDFLRKGVEAWNTWRDQHPKVLIELSDANLRRADLIEAILSRANLSDAHLIGAHLIGADLGRADLSRATVGRTIFGNVDLRTVKGLETVHHDGPSTIGTDTLLQSNGDIPET